MCIYTVSNKTGELNFANGTGQISSFVVSSPLQGDVLREATSVIIP